MHKISWLLVLHQGNVLPWLFQTRYFCSREQGAREEEETEKRARLIHNEVVFNLPAVCPTLHFGNKDRVKNVEMWCIMTSRATLKSPKKLRSSRVLNLQKIYVQANI